MIRSRIHRRSPQLRSAQRGVALAVALILLVIAVMLGLAASGNTLLQERMSANMYDRSLAFQRAESAARAAEDAITGTWQIADLSGVDCSSTGGACTQVPGNAFTGTDAHWVDVPDRFDVNDSIAPGKPQYTVELMATGSGEDDVKLNDNANSGDYGGANPPPYVAYYRVTARSSKPTDAGDRSIVVLQTTVKRPYY